MSLPLTRDCRSRTIRCRFYGSIKYEHLFRHEIANAIVLADEIEAYRSIYKLARPHEHLGFVTHMQVYLADPSQPWPLLP